VSKIKHKLIKLSSPKKKKSKKLSSVDCSKGTGRIESVLHAEDDEKVCWSLCNKVGATLWRLGSIDPTNICLSFEVYLTYLRVLNLFHVNRITI
jgi:hypothetical protein